MTDRRTGKRRTDAVSGEVTRLLAACRRALSTPSDRRQAPRRVGELVDDFERVPSKRRGIWVDRNRHVAVVQGRGVITLTFPLPEGLGILHLDAQGAQLQISPAGAVGAQKIVNWPMEARILRHVQQILKHGRRGLPQVLAQEIKWQLAK